MTMDIGRLLTEISFESKLSLMSSHCINVRKKRQFKQMLFIVSRKGILTQFLRFTPLFY